MCRMEHIKLGFYLLYSRAITNRCAAAAATLLLKYMFISYLTPLVFITLYTFLFIASLYPLLYYTHYHKLTWMIIQVMVMIK